MCAARRPAGLTARQFAAMRRLSLVCVVCAQPFTARRKGPLPECCSVRCKSKLDRARNPGRKPLPQPRGKWRCSRCRRTLPETDGVTVVGPSGHRVRVCPTCAASHAPCHVCGDLAHRRSAGGCFGCGGEYREETLEMQADQGLGGWGGRAMP